MAKDKVIATGVSRWLLPGWVGQPVFGACVYMVDGREGWPKLDQLEQRLLLNGALVYDPIDLGDRVTAPAIYGQKYDDLDGDGLRDSGEPGLNGWTIELLDPVIDIVIASTVTADIDLDNNGQIDAETESGWYVFDELEPGEYRVREILRDGWGQSSPTMPLYQPAQLIDSAGIDDPMPLGTALADLDHDGDLDLIVAHEDYGRDNTMQVLLNDGNGNYTQSGAYGWSSSYKDWRGQVVTGDFNGDSHIDVAMLDEDYHVNVFFNSGNGVLSAPITIHTGGTYSLNFYLAVADVDLDNDLDLLASYRHRVEGDGVSVMRNNGNGTFAAAERYVTNSEDQFVVIDLNGDQYPDMASGFGSRRYISFNNGDGTFAQVLEFTMPVWGGEYVTAGDLDGDNDNDVIFAADRPSGTDGGAFEIWLNDGDGNLTYLESIETDGNSEIYNVQIGDIDRDGDLDLFGSGSDDTVHVAINDGDASFTLGTAILAMGDNPRGMAVGDVNGDGYLDITVPYSSSDQTAVFLNYGAATDGMYRLKVEGDDVYAGRDFGNAEYGEIIGQVFDDHNADGIRQAGETPSNGWVIELVDVSTNEVLGVQVTGDIDLNDDGSIDPETERGVYRFTGLWPGDYEVRQFNQADYRQTLPSEYSFASAFSIDGFIRPNDLAIADFNDDGLADLVVAEDAGMAMSRVLLLANNGQSDFAEPIVLLTAEQTYTEYLLADVDADGDGDVDLLVVDDRNEQLIVLLNDGDGNLAVSGYFAIGASPERILVSDINNDNQPDVIITNEQDEQIYLMLNLGDGVYAGSTVLNLAADPDPEPFELELPRAVATGDIDGDGDKDLILGVGDTDWGSGPSDIRILLNDGHGGFIESDRFDLSNDKPEVIAVHDWDEDGDLDVLIARNWTTTMVLVNDGNGQMSATTLEYEDVDTLFFNDIDGDGQDDLVLGWYDHLKVTQLGVDQQWQEIVNLNGLAGSPVLLAEDIDGDGLRDLAGLNETTGQILILRNTRPVLITMESGQIIDSVDFANYQPNAIHGTLFNDHNHDGLLDAGDTPLSGWNVFIDVDGDGQFGQYLVETQASNVPLSINAQTPTVRSTIAVSGVYGVLEDLDISLNITHSQISELTVTLISPQGYRVELVSADGQTGSEMTGTVFDDQASISLAEGSAPYSGRFVPAEALERYISLNPNGVWTLDVIDNNPSVNHGMLDSWSMVMTVVEPSAITNAAGQYWFFNLPDGAYDIYEQLPLGWTSTSDGYQTITLADGLMETLDFANRQVGPPAELSMVLVRQPSIVDELGEADILPVSELWVHEWESFWVELWVDIPTSTAVSVQSILTSIDYQAQYITATEIVYGPAFSDNQTGTIDDILGQVQNLGAKVNPVDVVGDDKPVLVARVHFEPAAGDQVPVDKDDRFIGPYDLQLGLSDAQIQLTGFGAVTAEWGEGHSPPTQLWAIPYDANDDDVIDMDDFAELQSAFLLTASDGEPPYAWWADFDKTGLSDFGDFSYFAPNLGLSKPFGDILFPPGFPDTWNGPIISAALSHDTYLAGTTNEDGLTSDPSIVGTITDSVEIAKFSARVKGVDTGSWYDLTEHFSGQQFEINTVLLEQIYGNSLEDGDYEIEFVSENILGNRSSFLQSFTLDTVETSTAATPDLLAVYDRGISADDNLTNMTSPAVAVDAQPGQWVRLLIDGQAAVYAPHDGSVEMLLGPLDQGEYILTAMYEDTAGNVGDVSAEMVLIIDTTRPEVDAALVNDTGISSADSLTNDPQVNVTCDDLEIDTVIEAQINSSVGFIDITALRQVDGGMTLDQATLEQLNGAALEDGSYELRVRATDAAGNVSRIALLPFTLDQTAPAIPSFELQEFYDTDIVGDWHTILPTVSIVGQSDPDTQVATTDTNISIPIDALGQFELTDIALTMGDNSWSITATDAAGNQSIALQTIVRDAADSVTIADPDLAAAIRQQLGRAADHEIDQADMYLLFDLIADSNVIDNLTGLEHAVNLQSLLLEPADYTLTGSLSGLTSLTGLTSLESLTLIKLGLNDADLQVISQIDPIRQLVLRYNNLTDVSELANLVNLETLQISGNTVSDIDVFASRPIDIDFTTTIPRQMVTIADLAEAFHYMPLDIYEYVLNNFEFTPYYGLMKGSQGVLETRTGNDWELAHLLAGLFEESGINTRYVSGMVDADIDDVCNWLGVTSTNAASRILRAAGGFGDTSSAYLFRHTWLEAELLMPGGQYEWIAFDPSWKLKDYQPGVADMVTLVPFDEDDYLSQIRDEMAWEYYLDQVADYLALNQPQYSTSDVPYTGEIRRQVISVAPESLPYIVENVTRYDDYSDLSSLTHRAEVTLSYDETVLFQEMLVLPEVCLEPITITYVPAGGGNVIAQLNVGDMVIASGSPIASGSTVELLIDHYQPEDDEPYHTDDYQRTTDKVIAIGFDANQISPAYLDRLRIQINQAQIAAANGDGDAAAGEADTFLALAVLQYLDSCRQSDNVIAGLTQAIPVRSYVRSGTAIGELSLYGHDQLQVPLMPGKLVLDMPNMISPTWIAIEGFDWVVDPNNKMRGRLSNFNNSAQEHAIWQTLASTKAISTIMSLQLANERGVEILDINPDNAATEIPKLNLDAWVISNIQKEIGEGATFTVPVEMTPYDQWHGVGYIVEREDGSVGYIISGSLNSSSPVSPITSGGSTVSSEAETIVEVTQSLNQLTVNDPVNIANGVVTRDEIDVQFQTVGLPLAFSRHYDTQLSTDTGLGIGWTHSFSDYLTFHGNGDITWTTYMGNQVDFTYDGQGGYLSPAGTLGTLSTAGGGYAYREKDGTLHEFDAQGRLYRLSDRNDNTIVITYNGNGQLEKAYDSRHPERYVTFAVDGSGHITGMSDFTGRSWAYQYAGDYLVGVTGPSDSFNSAYTIGYSYYSDSVREGLLHTVTDPGGGVTTFDYYANRRAFSVTDGEGYVAVFNYDLLRQRTTYIDEHGDHTVYQYNQAGNLVERQIDHHTVERYEWTDGLMTAEYDIFGQVKTYEYNSDNDLVRLVDRDGTVTEYTYETTWHLPLTVSVAGRTTSYAYDDRGNLIRVEDPLGYVTTMTYDLHGSMTSVTTPRGNETPEANDYKTIYTYDIDGQVLSRSTSLSSTEQFTYDDRGNLLTETDANGHVTTYEYDLFDNRIRSIDPLNSITTYDFDAMGNMISVTDALGRTATFEYDLRNLLVKTTNTAGLTRMITYDAGQNPIIDIDEAGRVTWRDYGRDHQLLRTTYADGATEYNAYDRGGRLSAVTDALHYTTRFEYDALGRIVRSIDPLGQVTTTTYDTAGNVKSITEPGSRTTTYTYDAANRLISSTDPEGHTVTREYDANGNLVSITDGRGYRTRYVYDEMDRLIETIDASGGHTLHTYDAAGNLLTVTDANGHSTTYEYDAMNRNTAIIDAAGGRIINEYDALGQLVSTTNQNNTTTAYRYDGLGRLIVVTDPLGNQIVTRYDAVGNPVMVTDPLGNRQRFIYDARDRQLQVINAYGQTTTSQYDRNGNRIVVIDSLGRETRFEYDELGRVINETDALGHVTTTTYHPSGMIASVTDPLGRKTQFEYDRMDRLVRTIDPLGNETLTTYDAAGNQTTITDEAGRTTQYEFDALGRVITITTPLGETITSTYDAVGNVITATDALGRTTEYQYDELNRLVKVTDAMGSHSTTDYDAVGNVSSATDSLGRTTTYTYDALNRQTAVINAFGNTTSTDYDAAGNVVSVTDVLGRVTEYAYDKLNRLVSSTNALGNTVTTGYDAVGNVVEVIDALGHVTRSTYDALDRLIAMTDPQGNVTKTQYDTAGNIITLTDALGNSTTFTYDAMDRPVSVTDPLGNTKTTAYDAAGKVISVNDESGRTTEYGYDAGGRRKSVTDALGQTTETEYDAVGNVVKRVDALGRITTYSYDYLNRMTTITDALGQVTSTEYDKVGNIIAIVDALGRRSQYYYDSLNRQTVTIDAAGHSSTNEYDAVGNIIRTIDALGNETTYTYNSLNHLTSLTDALNNTTTTEYDATGNTTVVIDALGRRTEYIYDAMGRLITTTNTLSGTVVNEYDVNGNLVAITDELGNTTHLEVDALGRVITVTDALGNTTSNEYDAVGNLIRSVDSLGRVTTYSYDDLDRLVVTTDALGGTTTSQYDAVGNLLIVTDELGHTTEYDYDALNQLTAITDPLGNTSQSGFDAVGNLVSVTDSLGRITQYSYDALDRLITTTDALGATTTNQYDAQGNITSIIDERGNQAQFTYDALNRRVTITNALGNTVTRQYDAVGNLTSETDPLGRTTSYTYDGLNRRLAVIDALGNTSTTGYDAAGHLISVTDPLGNTTQYSYDQLGRLIETTNALGATMSATYDAVGNIIAATDWLGNETTHEYDDLDRNTQTTDALGQTQGRTYDAAGNLLSVIDPMGNTTIYTYDANDRLITVTDALGQTTTMAYDAAGNLISRTDPLGQTVSNTFDELNRRIAVIDALGNATTTAYDSTGNVISITDPLGNVSIYNYDALNQLVSQTDPLGNIQLTAYDAAGNIIGISDALGNVTTLAYDALNRVEVVTDPLGRKTMTTYDGYGNVIAMTDPLGRTTSSTYDALHRLIAITDALGYTTSTTYDEQGNILALTDASGQTTTFTYDVLNRQVSSTNPLGNITTTTYDAASNVIALTDPLGLATQYQYDALYRLIKVTDAEGNTTQTQYDAADNVIAIVDPTGNQTTQNYDANNRLISRTDAQSQTETWQYDDSGNLIQATDRNGQVRRYQYDDSGRRTAEHWMDEQDQILHAISWSYDSVGRMVSAGDDDCVIIYSYDAAGQLVTIDYQYASNMLPVSLIMTYDDAGNTVEIETLIDGRSAGKQQMDYDSLDQLIRTVQFGDDVSSKRIDLSYNPVGLLDTINRYGNLGATGTPVESTYIYDDAHRLANLTHQYATTTINAFDYTYDAGNRLIVFASNDGLAQFQYDDANQLIDADFDYQDDENYTYDDAGNRTNTGYTIGAANQLLSDGIYNYEYDNQGNRIIRTAINDSETVHYSWDYRNRLTAVVTLNSDGQVTRAVSYLYDVNDRRIEKHVDPDGDSPGEAVISRYVYNDVNIVLELDGDNQVTHRYLHGLAADQLFADEDGTGWTLWTLSDHQYTIRDLVQTNGTVADHRVYDSFGNITDQTDPDVDHDFAYTGRQLDLETGLYYYRARYYDAPVGRFVSEDPIAFDGGDTNLYRYVFNRPWTMTDPTGHFAVDVARGMSAVNNLSNMIDQAYADSGDTISGVSITGNLIDQFIDQMPGNVATTFDLNGKQTSVGHMAAGTLAFNPAMNFLNLKFSRPGDAAKMSAFDEVYEVYTPSLDDVHRQLVETAVEGPAGQTLSQQAVNQITGLFGIDPQMFNNLPQSVFDSMYGNATHYGDTGVQIPNSLGPENHSDGRTNLDAKLMMGQMMVDRLASEGRLTPDVMDIINDFYKNLLAGNKEQALAGLAREQQKAQQELDRLRQQEQIMQGLHERQEQIQQMQPGYDLLSALTDVNQAVGNAGKTALDWSIDKLKEHGSALVEVVDLYDEDWLGGHGGKTLETIGDFLNETWDFYAEGAVGDWLKKHGSALGELINTCYVEPAAELLDLMFDAAKDAREQHMQNWIDGKGYDNLLLAGLAALAEEENFGATFNTLTMGWGSGNIAKNILLHAGGGPGNKIAQVLNKPLIQTKVTAEIVENAEIYGISKANAKALQQLVDEKGLDVSIRWSNVDSLKYAAKEVPDFNSIPKPETVKLKTMKQEHLDELFTKNKDLANRINNSDKGPGLVWEDPYGSDFNALKEYYENYTDSKGNKIDFNFDEDGFLRIGEDYIHGDYDMSFVIDVKSGMGLTNKQTIKLGETLNEVTGTKQFQHGSQITWIENITNPSAKGRGIVGENIVFRPGVKPAVLTTKDDVASYLLNRGINPDAFVAKEISKQIAGQATILIYGDTVMAVRQGETN